MTEGPADGHGELQLRGGERGEDQDQPSRPRHRLQWVQS